MAIADMLKSIGFWDSTPAEGTLSESYMKYGAEMGFAGYDEFVQRANSFFDEAKAAVEENKEGYTRVQLNPKRVAFDYKCEMRGIYTLSGKPIAFFKPNFRTAGFRNADEEFEFFKSQTPS